MTLPGALTLTAGALAAGELALTAGALTLTAGALAAGELALTAGALAAGELALTAGALAARACAPALATLLSIKSSINALITSVPGVSYQHLVAGPRRQTGQCLGFHREPWG